MSLITVDELADRLAGPGVDGNTAVVDVRFALADVEQGRREYAAGHLPGAVFVDLHTELADVHDGDPSRGRHPLPPADEFTTLLGRLGIASDTFVVAYDSAGGATAARLWWMLRSIGHARVAVLDGGLPAWIAAGRALTTEVPSPAETTYPEATVWTGTVSADDVAAGARLGATIVDSRAADRYRGEVEPIDTQAGHIPGAVNRFHGDNVTPDGTHRPLAELADRFAGVGDSPIVYCGSGVTACHNLLAMSLVGIDLARLYPGSWSEWSSDPARPIATGDGP